jgi:hypothetical protein
LFDTAALPQQPLRALLVIPETGLLRLLLDPV